MFAKIRFYWGAFVISFVVAAIMIPMIYIFPEKKGTIMHRLNRVILTLLGAKLKKEGERDPEADIYMINHQGIIDIIALEAIENTHFKWVAKKELFDAVWFGRLLKKGDMISVDRENKAGLVKLLKDVKKSIESGERAIAIFPEGTRSSGQKLLKFKSGPGFIASKLSLKVQPIVVTGSKYLLNEHDKTAHNSTVNISYLPSFTVDGSDPKWYDRLYDTMQKKIDEKYEKEGIAR